MKEHGGQPNPTEAYKQQKKFRLKTIVDDFKVCGDCALAKHCKKYTHDSNNRLVGKGPWKRICGGAKLEKDLGSIPTAQEIIDKLNLDLSNLIRHPVPVDCPNRYIDPLKRPISDRVRGKK